MSEPDEQQESDYECPGCGQQCNGPWSLYNHTLNCQKELLMDSDAADPQDKDDPWAGDDLMGSSS